MKSASVSLITACACAALTAGGLFLVHRKHTREAYALRGENARLTLQALDRQRAAHSPTSVPVPSVEARAAAAVSVPTPSPQPAVPPTPNYRNEGQDTARAALQTFAWACDQGDSATVARLLCFDEKARAKAEAWFSSMPPEAKSQWRSVDEMAASLLTLGGMSSPFPSADVLDRVTIETTGDDRARLRLPGTRRDGTEFQRTPDGWKFVVTEALVEGYLARQTRNR